MLKHRNFDEFKEFLNTGRGRVSLIIVIAVILLLAAVLPSMLTFGVTDKERNLAAALVDLSQAKNKTITGDASLQLGGVNATVDLNLSASSIQQSRGELGVKATIGADTFEIPVEFVYDQDEKEQYYKLSNLDGLLDAALNPDAPVSSQIKNLAKKLDGNWLKLSAENLKGLTDGSPVAESTVGTDQCTPQLLSKIQTHPAAKESIAEVLASDSLFAIEDISKVDDGSQYTITVQSDEVDKAIKTLKQTELFKAADKCDQDYDPFKSQAQAEVAQATPQPANQAANKPVVELKIVVNKQNQIAALTYSSKSTTQVITANIKIASDKKVAVASPKSDVVDYSSVAGQVKSIFKILSTPPENQAPASSLVQPYGM